MAIFINRLEELKALNKSRAKLIILFGRRRIGKTTLVEKWGKDKAIAYTQAIEGSEAVQIEQITSDLKEVLPSGIQPRSWSELLSTFTLIKRRLVLVMDEFPYLVKNNPSLPSLFQKWIDHEQPDNLQLVLLGSSQSMMHGLFLKSDAPLYERADLILKLEPMSYRHFCKASSCKPLEMDSFLKFSMIGGVPRYWEYIEGLKGPIEVAQNLFFEKSARLEDEPDRILKDEDIIGQQAKAIFESLGRGASKPSEIAGRMEIPQTALTKPMGILMYSHLVKRSIPFGESPRNAKKTIYSIDDYALRFWYQIYSTHRTRWHLYERDTKLKFIRDHASKVLEDEYRKLFVDASQYWEGSSLEIDCVRYSPKNLKKLILTEIKLRNLSEKEKVVLSKELEQKFSRSLLAKKFTLDRVEILGGNDVLERLAWEVPYV